MNVQTQIDKLAANINKLAANIVALEVAVGQSMTTRHFEKAAAAKDDNERLKIVADAKRTVDESLGEAIHLVEASYGINENSVDINDALTRIYANVTATLDQLRQIIIDKK